MDERDVTDRRRRPRTTLGLPATLRLLGPEAEPAMAMTCDVSEAGASIVGPARFNTGDVVLVTITRGEMTAVCQGLIVGYKEGSDDTAMLNIAFETSADEDLLVLRRIIGPS